MTISIKTFRHSEWLTNTYLICSEASKSAILVDAGAPIRHFKKELAKDGYSLRAILLTHAHFDHVDTLPEWTSTYDVDVYGHALASAQVDALTCPLQGGETLSFGGISVQVIPTPGHSSDHLSFLVADTLLFAGDILFKGSVGGTEYGNFEALKFSLQEVLMKLPHELTVYPGHAEPTTLNAEWTSNPFIRAWRGLDKTLDIACIMEGKPATLRVKATDYDGEGKVWISVAGKNMIVPEMEIKIG